MEEAGRSAATRFPIWETVAIFLAIASLWPAYILKLKWGGWRVVSYVMFALMAVVAVRRLLAFRRFAREAEEARRKEAESGKQQRARLPWESPTDEVRRDA